MPQVQSLTRTRISGEIVKIKFEDPKDGFAVLDILCDDGRKVTVCGNVPFCAEGRCIEADGYFEKHATFGLQFKMESCRSVLPVSARGIERYLRYLIPGIGEKTAAAIVKCFGKETVQVLDLYPRRLLEVPKIGRKKAEAIIAGWKEARTQRDDMIFLQGLGITPAYCAKLFKQYGENTVDMVRSNPYRLAEDVNGIGFAKADAIAKELGFAAESVERMEAAAVYVIDSMLGEGHSCCPEGELLDRIVELTSQGRATAARGVAEAVRRRLLYCDRGFFYTPYPLLAESRLPVIISKLAASKRFAGAKLGKVSLLPGLTLDVNQLKAVESVALHPLNIITGGPGVGKTTVIGEIVRRAKKMRLKIALAAPTGRAAKRMSESAGYEAKTLHRLLVFDPESGTFVYNDEKQLDCDLLIVDEVSMLDVILAYQLFQAVPVDCSVVLVGDADQLPSVGPGRVLHDFMQSGFFAVTQLTKVFRQSSGSSIITNAHRVRAGQMPLKQTVSGEELADFYWIEQEDPEKVMETVCKLVSERIPLRFGFDRMEDIQVLCPMNRGNCGTVSLNEALAAMLNGEKDLPSFQFGTRTFRHGDRVMQTANNYDKNVFNGDLGRIASVSSAKHTFIVEYDGGRPVEYSFDEAGQLALAYAITIHKSQGSEFPVVVLPLLTQHFVMLQRNLLYTGMTRARQLLVLVGSQKAVNLSVSNMRLRPRYSLLCERFRAQMDEAKPDSAVRAEK